MSTQPQPFKAAVSELLGRELTPKEQDLAERLEASDWDIESVSQLLASMREGAKKT